MWKKWLFQGFSHIFHFPHTVRLFHPYRNRNSCVQKSKSIWRRKKQPMLAPTLTLGIGGKIHLCCEASPPTTEALRGWAPLFPTNGLAALITLHFSLWELQQAAPRSGLLKVRRFILLPVKNPQLKTKMKKEDENILQRGRLFKEHQLKVVFFFKQQESERRAACLRCNLDRISTSKRLHGEDTRRIPGRRRPFGFPIWFSLLVTSGRAPESHNRSAVRLRNYTESSQRFIIIALLPPCVPVRLHFAAAVRRAEKPLEPRRNVGENLWIMQCNDFYCNASFFAGLQSGAAGLPQDMRAGSQKHALGFHILHVWTPVHFRWRLLLPFINLQFLKK